MLRILHGTNYDFIKHWRTAAIVTVVFIVLGVGSAIFRGGFPYSIEFTGGTLMQVQFEREPDVAKLRTTLDNAGVHGAEITTFGTNRDFTIRAQEASQVAEQAAGAEKVANKIEAALKGAFTDNPFKIGRTETVGPRVGGELRRGAIIAILISFVVTLAYLAWRFEWRFGLAAVAATAHDIILTIGFIAIMRLEVSLVVVAAVLSMVGYSLNDTIIIFDRVRENLHKYKRDHFADILNRSINETLPRSILTHGTTLATLTALAVFGGEVIRPFALVMFFGVFTGTFSSIFIASPVLMWIEHKWPGADARGVKNIAPKTTADPREAVATK